MLKFGKYDINIDIEYYRQQCKELILNSTKISGFKKHNKLIGVPDQAPLMLLAEQLTENEGLDWNFDYFHSGEPVGLHTDNDTVPWDKDTECQVIASLTIPLEWNCKQPYTIFYDKVSHAPRKMIFRKGDMRYTDNNEIFEYRTEWKYDDKVIQYNPEGTQYYKEYADLLLYDVYQWKIQTAVLSDASRWHSSSWWLNEMTIPDVSNEWKRAILGFGSRDVPIGTQYA